MGNATIREVGSFNWFVECQWWPVLTLGKGFNWINFDFVKLSAEYDKFGPQVEIEVALLGFRFGCTIPTGMKTEQSEMAQAQLEAVKNGTAKTHSMDEVFGSLSGGMKVTATDQAAEQLAKFPPEMVFKGLAQIAQQIKSRHGAAVDTPVSQAGNAGSTPAGGTKDLK